jgi:hypothetical protein
MQHIQILKEESHEWYNKYNKNYIVHVINSKEDADPSIPIVCAGDLLHENVRYWLTHNYPAVYLGRGYLGNHLHKQRKFWRFSVNGWANTMMLPIPYSRWNAMQIDKHPWKVKEVKRVLIAPSKMTSKVWTPELKYNWAESMLDKFPGAEVRIRKKLGKSSLRWNTLWSDFDWADLVVSQSSAITVEAFWYGKKVISLEPCPTWAAEKFTLDDWQNPKEPELRDAWHEHLAWCQYTVDEIRTGNVLDLVQSYVGNIGDYKSTHTYNLYRN